MNLNNQETKISISLEDFPDDVYILLEGEFRSKFFKTVLKIFGGYKGLMNVLKVSRPTIVAWKRGINGAHRRTFISLRYLKEIIKLCNNKNDFSFTLDEIGKNINGVRIKNGRRTIFDPKLPFEDSIELREVITHLLCDGYASLKNYMTSKYELTSLEAVKEFQKELTLFGKISPQKITSIKIKNSIATSFRLSFPKTITKILSHKFNLNFDWDRGRLPREFLEGDRKLLVAVVRAFFIDEGHIKDLCIKFSSANLKLLQDLERICTKLDYKSLGIKKGKTCYLLPLSTFSFPKIYKDIMSIAPIPIIEKQNRLELASKLLNKRYVHFDVKKEILHLLSRKPMTTSELCKIIVARRNNIHNHLNQLKKRSRVEVCFEKSKGKGGEFIWRISS